MLLVFRKPCQAFFLLALLRSCSNPQNFRVQAAKVFHLTRGKKAIKREGYDYLLGYGYDYAHLPRARTFTKVRFTQGDAQDLPFERAGFDRVLMNFGLLHVSHPERACAEACRVLKPGGKFGFT